MFVIPNGAHLPFSKCVGDLIFFYHWLALVCQYREISKLEDQ